MVMITIWKDYWGSVIIYNYDQIEVGSNRRKYRPSYIFKIKIGKKIRGHDFMLVKE